MIMIILFFSLSFSQFEAGQKAIGGEVSDFSREISTWTYQDDEIKYIDATIGLNSTVSYFIINNLAISVGIGYKMNNKAWECNDQECSDEWFGDEIVSKIVNPFSYMIGGAYYRKNVYGHASFYDLSSEIDDDSYFAFGAGYMLELATGIYFDVKAEYRYLLSEALETPNDTPEIGTRIGNILNATNVESKNLNLYGSIGVTVVF